MTTDAQNRHAYVVEPTGESGFLYGQRDPSLGTSGGHSAAMGFGPYTLAPGESVRIVLVEAAAGLSREANERIGRAYKAAPRNTRDTPSGILPVTINGESGKTKAEWVFTSRDSLFQTFRRAIANHASGYALPEAPRPPAAFSVEGLGDRISLSWLATAGGPTPDRYEIYRAQGREDSAYVHLHTAPPEARSFDDVTALHDRNYFYYLVAVKDGAERPLKSSRYETQTYHAAQVKYWTAAASGEHLPDHLHLHPATPNPFGAQTTLRFDVPEAAEVTITIYNALGSEVARLADGTFYPAGTHDLTWDAADLPSGVYLVRLTAGGHSTTRTITHIR